jgi:hypothetical protein
MQGFSTITFEGLNPFSEEYRTRLNEMAVRMDSLYQLIDELASKSSEPNKPVGEEGAELVALSAFVAVLGAATAIDAPNWRWEYEWFTGKMVGEGNTGGYTWVPDFSNPERWDNFPLGDVPARNLEEQLNTDAYAVNNTPLDMANATLTPIPIPTDTPVIMIRAPYAYVPSGGSVGGGDDQQEVLGFPQGVPQSDIGVETDISDPGSKPRANVPQGTVTVNRYFFSATNAIVVECSP